jgi:hypothetical protein
MWAAMWMWPGGPFDLPRQPSVRDRVLSRTRHVSFSAEVAERLVHELSRRQLVQLWDETTTLLGQPILVALRINVVVLRDHLLRRLEAFDPEVVEVCLRTGRPSRIRRLRGARP